MIKELTSNWGRATGNFYMADFELALPVYQKILTYKIPFALPTFQQTSLKWLYGISLYNLGFTKRGKRILDELPLDEFLHKDKTGYTITGFAFDFLHLNDSKLRAFYLEKALAAFPQNKRNLTTDLDQQFQVEKRAIQLLIKSESHPVSYEEINNFFRDLSHPHVSNLIIELLKRTPNRADMIGVTHYLKQFKDKPWAKSLLDPSVNVMSIKELIDNKSYAKKNLYIPKVEDVWWSKLDKKLFELADSLAKKHYNVLLNNHSEILKILPTDDDRLYNICDNFYRLLRSLKVIMSYLDSLSPKVKGTIAIKDKLPKALSTYLLPSKDARSEFQQKLYEQEYPSLRWERLNAESRKKLKIYYKDITDIMIYYILSETGGYIDKRIASKLGWAP